MKIKKANFSSLLLPCRAQQLPRQNKSPNLFISGFSARFCVTAQTEPRELQYHNPHGYEGGKLFPEQTSKFLTDWPSITEAVERSL